MIFYARKPRGLSPWRNCVLQLNRLTFQGKQSIINSMKAIRVIKLKFTGNHKADQILPNWLDACNWLSKIIYEQKDTNSNRLAKIYYGTVREKFSLPSQLTCTLFRTVTASYMAQKSKQPTQDSNYCQPKSHWRLAKILGYYQIH